MTGWTTADNDTSVLVERFLEERTYFMYKSFWLLEPLNMTALNILMQEALNVGTGPNSGNYLLFEFQSLGGHASYQRGTDNKFASVDPFATAFAHRHARHCLMFKANGLTADIGKAFVKAMAVAFNKLRPFVAGDSSYVNHLDFSLANGELQYFYNGVTLNNPGVHKENATYWVDKLRRVRCKYNPDGIIHNSLPFGIAPAGHCESRAPPTSTSGRVVDAR